VENEVQMQLSQRTFEPSFLPRGDFLDLSIEDES
jgi:hypothetical protein